jgi:hypothetical protein
VTSLTGCQSTAPDYDEETAAQFQLTVLDVTQAVADGDLQVARDTLISFDAELDKAAADGAVSFARHQRIDAALALVLADVDAALAAQAPAPQPEVTPDPVSPTAPVTDDGDDGEGDGDNSNNGNDGNNGNGNSGNGNNGNKDKAPQKDKPNKKDKSDD